MGEYMCLFQGYQRNRSAKKKKKDFWVERES